MSRRNERKAAGALWRSRLARMVGVPCVAAVVFAGAAAGANAAGTAFGGGSFCKMAATYSHSDVTAADAALSTTTLKSDFEKLRTAEPLMLADAPSTLRPDLEKIFAFDNTFIGELEKANFNFEALAEASPSALLKLKTSVTALKPVFTALETYFKTTCGVTTP